jgi:hypothetical protein
MPIGLVLLLALAVFLPGIDWGLPSHRVDPFLFGDRPVWTGAKINALSGGWDADAAMGADVARHPLGRSEGEGPILVNGDDVARARIVQRYRLYSDQPDEMITFRALSGIDAAHGKLDPKLYQYGGLWIYAVGGLLAAAKELGAITVRHDVAYYLDHPEAFGRFYIVARLYAATWGLVLVAAVYGLMRQLGSSRMWSAIGAAAVVLMPVVVNAAHEAKPHLPGAAIVLLAVWAGSEYARSGNLKWLLACGGLCGAAMGMVLWAAPVFLVVVVAVYSLSWSAGGSGTVGRGVARTLKGEDPLPYPPPEYQGREKMPRWRGALTAIGLGLIVYAITNPYVVIHLIHDPAVLRSNLQNTSAMYGVHSSLGAMSNAVMLIFAGMSPVLAAAGFAGAIALSALACRRGTARPPYTAVLLTTVAIVLAIPYVALAAGKPGEYGRFALVPDVALAIAAVKAIEILAGRARIVIVAALLAATAIFGVRYTTGFVRDCGPNSSRLIAAEALQSMPGDRLAIAAEPAPYCLPPVDLFRWKLLLTPKWSEADRVADVSCKATDGGLMSATPLSWADKGFEISK